MEKRGFIVNYWNALESSLKQIYSIKGYYLLTIIFAVAIYSLNALIHNYRLVFDQFSFLVMFNLILYFHQTIGFSSYLFLAVLSVLTGVIVAMSVYLLRRQIKTGVYASSSGFIASLLAPACPSCALGIFGMIGLGGFISVLPFKGLELGILGLLIVVVSMFYLGKKINTTVCEIKKIK